MILVSHLLLLHFGDVWTNIIAMRASIFCIVCGRPACLDGAGSHRTPLPLSQKTEPSFKNLLRQLDARAYLAQFIGLTKHLPKEL
jgi:hypothetical protein